MCLVLTHPLCSDLGSLLPCSFPVHLCLTNGLFLRQILPFSQFIGCGDASVLFFCLPWLRIDPT